ncbi:MAG: tRNA (guanosine(37)-N1)-methyltransferase TrmD, partial [Candidatus Pacebacteria bacterium]|nr:tRNA (guanosine(37)-N1)-methyltransferase TrmD [Candidatus Paceibacterota bacterium]
MRIVILTLFPDYFANLFSVSLIGKAIASGKANVDIVQIRDFAHDTQRTTDDRPFGGGPGMVMKVEPIALALESVKASIPTDQKVIVLLTSAQGKMYTQ